MNSQSSGPAGFLCVVLLVLAGASASGQAPIISSFGPSGVLVCTNLEPGSTASVRGALSVLGPWTNRWASLDAVAVDPDGAIRVSVSEVGVAMFYRVLGVAGHPFLAPTNMALIPAGSFLMGDTFNEGFSAELPTHTVKVSAFYTDRTEVTLALWQEVRDWATLNEYTFDHEGSSKGLDHPVHTVNWYDVVKWCNARSEKEGRVPAYYTDAGLTSVYRAGQVAPNVRWDQGYRLPTEAEWEKAARGGASGHRFPWSDVETISHSQANYYSGTNYAYDISPTRGFHPLYATGGYPYTSPVSSFNPNGYGLHEMAGNLFELCWDWYDGYSSDSQTDPRGSGSGSGRVVRGGSWGSDAGGCRVSYRYFRDPSFWDNGRVGFRSVLPPSQ